MELQFRFDVSDRQQVDGRPGLHAGLLFRRADADVAALLEGTASVSDDGDPGAVTIKADGLHLDDATADELIRTAISEGWNDIFGNDFAAVGTHWKPLEPWLQQHFGTARAAAALDEIAAKLASSDAPKRSF